MRVHNMIGAVLVLVLALGLAGTDLPGAVFAETPASRQVAMPPSESMASLLADRVKIRNDNTLVAEGNVEIFYQSNRLSAKRVIYDQARDKLTIEGPIRMVQPGASGSVVIADQAELSPDLQSGVMKSARMVMSRELQIAAARIERKDGTITRFDRVVASSCQVCRTDPTPLWEIRAREVVHNATTRQIIFRDAQLRAIGVPIAYLPALRVPDPSVKRMSGFLRPAFPTTTSLGFGVKLPYFIALGPSRDLTVTPYLATSHTTTLGLRYRQAYDFGNLTLRGALSRDNIIRDTVRGYLFGDLDAHLNGGYNLQARLRVTSDNSYPSNYGITDDDRLWSGVMADRTTNDTMFQGQIGNTHTLRATESNSMWGTAEWAKIFHPARLGGEATLGLSALVLRPASTSSVDGRDMVRGSVTADWRRNWLFGPGLLGTIQTRYAADLVGTGQDPNYPRTELRGQPTLAAQLRWPWVNSTGRASCVIEPVAQVVWSPDRLKTTPDEDSSLTEFDEGNLFSLTRYPGEDRRERGLRANLGVSWTRYDASGWSLGTTVGRIFRQRNLTQFTSGTGLAGIRSDWLVFGQLGMSNGLTLSNRALFDNGFSFSRNELRLSYNHAKGWFGTGYLWMEANAAEKRDTDISEMVFDTAWNWNSGWAGTLSSRYDFTAQRMARARVGLSYSNECLTIDLSLSRRFTSSTSVSPETDFGLSVQLVGFGAGATGTARPSCAG